jgi:hypothetical protein
MQFNPITIKNVVDDMNNALKQVGEKHNISFITGKIKYSSNFFKTKIDCVINEQGLESGQVLFNKYCSLIGMTPDDYHRYFTFANHTYQITGINIKSRKYNVIVINVETLKEFRFQDSLVKERILADKLAREA